MDFNYKLYPGRKKEIIKFEQEYKPEVTIITAYYNGDKYIDETINSVLNQTFPAWEWLIINDGSTNKESIEKLKEIEKIDRRIKIINKNNTGLAATRDYGAKLADKNSKYLFFLDDDDLINKTYLECAYWTLQTNKDASWTYTDLVNFQKEEFQWIKYFDSDIEKKENLLVATALIRKKDFWEVNGYELREKAVNEDWNLWLKLLAKGKKPVRMNFIGFWYRKKFENSELERSKQNRERALSIINKTAKTITQKVRAVQYPKSDYNWQEIVEEMPENVHYKIEENNKINVLMIIPWMITGGADKFNLDLVTRTNKEKFNFIIVNTNPKVNLWKQDFEEQAIVYDLTTFIDQKYWVAFINNLIEEYRINLILNTNSLTGYSMIPYLKSKYSHIPIVDYIHMEEWYNRCGGYSRDSSAVAQCIDKTLVCNENSRKILINHFKREEEDIRTVYIGVDEKIYDPNKYNEEEIRKQYKLKKDDKRYILSYICRIDLQKRPMLLAEILRELRNRRTDFLCLIAGDGPMLEKLKGKLKRYDLMDNVKFLGNIKETAKLYKISDLTINCSIKEGVALTSYESLAMGVPVVSSNVGGQAELINDKVGVVVPCIQKEENIKVLKYEKVECENYVDGIEKILNNLDSYKANCRKRILNGFTIDQMVNNMENILENIVKKQNFKKIKTGEMLKNTQSICKELITENFIVSKNEYCWLCDQVNLEYFGMIPPRDENSAWIDGGYDYFKTPIGRFRLFMIKVTKKLHLYENIKRILVKMRKEE
ncbi:MAG: glycosyltransferase [Clostridia bacterium]|jgi:glycosyltransferase involved in cell wall biosynthesis|nr:glycosyltransferase [Clostridia bacterium]